MPERSFFAFGYQFPVCARCTGIMAGELFSMPLFILFKQSIIASILLTVPMAVDGIMQYKTDYISNNFKRVVTGFLFGYGFFSIIIRWIMKFIK